MFDRLIRALLLGSIIVTGIYAYAYGTEKNKHLNTKFALDSIAAANDTQIVIMRGELNTTIRRAIQAETENDSLSRLLRSEKTANYQLTGRISTLTDSIGVLSSKFDSACTEDCTLYAHFDEYNEPFRLTADVSFKYLLDSAFIKYAIKSDSIPIRLSIECVNQPGGIRFANVALTAPSYFDVSLDSLKQERTVCNPQIVKPPSSVFTKVVWFGIGAGSLYLAARTANLLSTKR